MFLSKPCASICPPDMQVQWQTGGEQRLWIRSHLGHEPYWIALPVPEAAHNDGMLSALLLSLGLGLLAIVTAYLIQRHINRPLRDLADAARRLSAGDAPQALRVDGPTEIAQVSAAFNQMVQALQEADATRSLMLAGISHDIRTPLTKLRLAVAMTTPSDEHDALAVSTDHYLDQIDAILQQFMDYAGSGAREVAEVGDLNALVSSLAADFAGLGHVFTLTLGELRPFSFRPISVMRVLMNLMQNAVVYGRVGLSVRTSTDDAGNMIYVEIGDRGKGVNADELDTLKAPFKRGRSTGRASGGNGSGSGYCRKDREAAWRRTSARAARRRRVRGDCFVTIDAGSAKTGGRMSYFIALPSLTAVRTASQCRTRLGCA